MLSVTDLTVSAGPRTSPIGIVRGVSLGVDQGEILCLVGESGCGKSMTSLALMGLLPPGARVSGGSVELDGHDITHLAPHRRVRAGRGKLAMVFQEPMTSLNPVTRIGWQIEEAVRVHDPDANPTDRARELLEMVRIPDAANQLSAYPHELSGGMRQRVMIAIALACRPRVLIADEPTTALDVTIQRQVLGIIRELCDDLDMGVIFITHDLGVVAQIADRVAVMYAGRLVETGAVAPLFRAPLHPYTERLMACLPDPAARSKGFATIPGSAPRPGEIPDGCAFAPRCPRAQDVCRGGEVPVVRPEGGRRALCHFPLAEGETA
ncbi:peptide/nickel transport system ATP-binding protein [Palleronia aestuarii]|uniref:Peptide/nickel transport system ATP-binding protein n=1 Tax=Palleronia aestuarii TaxID=568105 RepID=A0A2W7N5W1_9RHOB|nr:ABC transporter ATP-binding protein [Palleronia aestuarii]PZX13667.1 peptide/nickel transport system ATP-binding protein [Palleronia aestuarii]